MTHALSMTPAEGLVSRSFAFSRLHRQKMVDRTQRTAVPPVAEAAE
jgi:hypothetical protein